MFRVNTTPPSRRVVPMPSDKKQIKKATSPGPARVAHAKSPQKVPQEAAKAAEPIVKFGHVDAEQVRVKLMGIFVLVDFTLLLL